MLDDLDELGPFSVALGADLATVHLGPARADVFERSRVADVLPRTSPEFGRGYADPVSDPSGGRIGYRLAQPRIAAELALQQRLPFAVCAP